MEKTIDLEEIILEAYGCKDAHDFQQSFDISMQMIKEISIEAIRQALDLAAENAKMMDDPYSYCGNTGSEYPADQIIDRQSIRDTIKQIV